MSLRTEEPVWSELCEPKEKFAPAASRLNQSGFKGAEKPFFWLI